MTQGTPAAADRIGAFATGLQAGGIPGPVADVLRRVVLDSFGLMVAARDTDYVRAVIDAADGTGACEAVGHDRRFDPLAAALINGTAIHGEDFDDTFEGTPVHVGAVMVPAILAAADQRKLSGEDVLRGLTVGSELICRLALVAPTAMHRQGFHPTAICGAFGAAAGIATALRLTPAQIASALGIVGSMASGIIEYLAEGTWTKRMHPGWAAGAGWRAARMAEAGFIGPRTVFEGEHGAFHAFAVKGIERDFSHLTDGWGDDWRVGTLAFKPYACGTMAQPFIDCALQLRDAIGDPGAIESITAQVGEGTVHRLWEPLSEKRTPTTPYGAKFSVPYCVAVSLVTGKAGLEEYTDARIADPAVLSVAEKVGYEIDPDNEYPRNYTGALTVTLRDGRVLEASQPCLRGGKKAPLSDGEIVTKFMANARFGGLDDSAAQRLRQRAETLFDEAAAAA